MAGERGTLHAPFSARLGRALLGIYSWTTAGYELVAAVMLLLQNPRFFSRNACYWILCGLIVPALLAATGRRLSFVLRYALVTASLLGEIVLIQVTAGMSPTWVLLVLMLVSLTGMLFGARMGAAVLIGLAAISVGIAWSWVRGWLPVAGAYSPILDFRRPEVWTRVLVTTGVGTLGVLLLLRYILRSLYETLESSNLTVRDLIAERARRARAVEKVRESEERFEKAFRSGPDPMTISEFESGRFLDVNDSFERVLGYSREEAVGRTSVELGTWPRPEDRKLFLARLRLEGSIRDYEVDRVTRDGRRITCVMNAERVNLGGVACVLAAERDITARKRAEAALRESEEKFSTVFRVSPIGIVISDFATGRVLDANDAYMKIFECGREQTLGRTTLEIGLWREPRQRDQIVAELEAGRPVRHFKLHGRTVPGRPITLSASTDIVEMSHGKRLISMLEDITDLERAEAERLEAIQREMRARGEFTRRLIGAQEAERRRIAGELHDSLGQNLLLVKNRAQMAISRLDAPAELRAQLEGIRDLAAQSIAEVRQLSHELRPFHLDQLGLTRSLRAMVEAAAESAAVRFECRVEPVDDVFPPEAAMHVYRIAQECLNNILKHSGARNARLVVERDLREVQLRVEDDGRGFEPEAGAPGLGLHNIMERARILGGTVRIDARPGQGTRLDLVIAVPESPSGEKAPS